MPHIEIDLRRCTGCRLCEQVCAFAHEGVFGTARARIRLLRRDVLVFEAKVCNHCAPAHCVSACPTEALARPGDTTIFDPDLCTGCGACVDECDLLFWDDSREQPFICDVCGECVSRCPEDAIVWIQ